MVIEPVGPRLARSRGRPGANPSSFDRLVGSACLAAAVVIGTGRVFFGAHYRGDILAGCLVGLAVAFPLTRVGGQMLQVVVRYAERITDPVLAPIWLLQRMS